MLHSEGPVLSEVEGIWAIRAKHRGFATQKFARLYRFHPKNDPLLADVFDSIFSSISSISSTGVFCHN